MFDLEHMIGQWRRAVSSTDSVGRDDIDELESHLRDLVADLGNRGLNESEAFLVASGRLGTPAELGAEYPKVNGSKMWTRRVLWMLGGYITYRVCSALIGSAAAVASTTAALSTMSANAVGAVNAVVSAAGWSVVLLIAYRQSGKSTVKPFRISVGHGVLIGIALVAAGCLQMLATMLQTRLIGASEFGESQIWRAYGTWFVQFAVFVVSVALMCILASKKDDAEATAC